MKGTKFSCGRLRPLALTMPAVTVLSKPKGEPIATTHSPTLSRFGSPIRTAGSPVASILISARSVRLSAPITRALNSRLSFRRTVISSAESATCAVRAAADDEARAERAALEVARPLSAGPRRARDEAPEEIVERIVFLEIRTLRRRTALANLRGTDVDEGGAFASA